jgi:hypothetical protein
MSDPRDSAADRKATDTREWIRLWSAGLQRTKLCSPAGLRHPASILLTATRGDLTTCADLLRSPADVLLTSAGHSLSAPASRLLRGASDCRSALVVVVGLRVPFTVAQAHTFVNGFF